MKQTSLLYHRDVPINDSISIHIPLLGEVIDHEEEYYSIVSALTAMPIDMMVQLDDIGIDFTTLNEYELFLLVFPGIRSQNTTLVLGDLDLSKFKMAISEDNGDMILLDPENDIVIDREIHARIADTLRRIHRIEKNRKKPANEDAKRFMIDRARKKQARERRKQQQSYLEPLIVALVNTEQFKYDFEHVRDISIYQFNESLRQVIQKVDYDNRMYGVYAGTISVKDLSQDDLNWLVHK